MIPNGIIFNLSYYYPIEFQNRAIEYIVNSKDITEQDIGELLNRGCKDTFENTIKIFISIDYPRNRYAIPGVFELLKDLSWPGSMDALHLLGALDPSICSGYLNEAIEKALILDDEDWIYGISILVDSYNLQRYINSSLIDLFSKAVERYKSY